MDSQKWMMRLSELLSNAVNLEHQAFYFYLAAGIHFDSPAMSLLNLRDFFYGESDDELKHARILIEFINQRGLGLKLENIATEDLKSLSIQEIFEKAEAFEQAVLDHYKMIQKEADEVGDYATTQFIDYFLDKQVREVKEFHDRAMNARRCSCPLGEFIFDQSFSRKQKLKKFKQ
ncbi:uncharacterized protein VICG_01889 [Vittaforma corneae ATCC 50505]|uniref:Ferritin n=1 Tax=Vittaforma corneae (strain ATCC 50505) TaxID=993615 RepID=L2GJT4_VITCO|nr:uncharacterized protein VICG_01889 [Vittaforma corneae ATCC 50505]ELA41096.1 hypothetical protein VICG_01889 [Vittaforma corneae ATCC 50505]